MYLYEDSDQILDFKPLWIRQFRCLNEVFAHLRYVLKHRALAQIYVSSSLYMKKDPLKAQWANPICN